MRGRYMGLDDTICFMCGHKGNRYLSCCWIGVVLEKEKEFQGNQRNSWIQGGPSTRLLPVVETTEERKIRNARIAPNTTWNTVGSALPIPQAGPSNYTTAAVTTRFQKRPTKCDIATPTPINTNLPYNRWQYAFCKKVEHNVQTCTKKHKTLKDLNNPVQSSLTHIINSRRVYNRWEDGDKDIFLTPWIDQGLEIKEAYQAYIKVCPI